MTSQTKILNKSHLIGGFLLQKIDPPISQNLITNLENIINFSKTTFLIFDFKNKNFWDMKKSLNSLPPFCWWIRLLIICRTSTSKKRFLKYSHAFKKSRNIFYYSFLIIFLFNFVKFYCNRFLLVLF